MQIRMGRFSKSAWLAPVVAAAAAFGLVWGISIVQAQEAHYAATLSGDAEVPSLTSTGSGDFRGTLVGDTLNYRLVANGEGLTQSHIHVGAADANGPVVVFLFGPEDAGVSSIDVIGALGAADMVEGTFQEMIYAINSGNAYVNVHSIANPAGEVRGQIAMVAAPDFPPVAPEVLPAPEVPPTAEIIAAPGALPSTGSGGLAATDGGTPAWLWVVVAVGVAFGGVVVGQRALRRR